MQRDWNTVRHEFVEFVPEQLADGILYISVAYATAVHRCFCGCGRQVVTPLSPTDWKLLFDGRTVSLYPSIGNWTLPCRSHYWIAENQVCWADAWSSEQIAAEREADRFAKDRYFDRPRDVDAVTAPTADKPAAAVPSAWHKLQAWIGRTRD